MVGALARGDADAARKALESDIGRAFDLVMRDTSFWREKGGAA
jgi:DNA-binding GntR family transcriptional regulator